MEGISTYPLCWPIGWKRTSHWNQERAKFHTNAGMAKRSKSINEAVSAVLAELKRMGIDDWNVIISTNLKLRLDGYPLSSQREPDDQGVAVYWMAKGKQRVMAIDKYQRIADNIYAVAKTLECMRAIERYGSAEILDRSFTGFQALPAPVRERWWEVLNVDRNASHEVVEASYKKLRLHAHPDHLEGSVQAFNRIQDAWSQYNQERS